MQSALSFSALTKRYPGEVGVFSLSLDVEAGSCFGFIGENGAGKSTTIRCALGLIRPTSGSISMLGTDVTRGESALRARVGYVPSEPGLWDTLSVKETLAYLGGFVAHDTTAHRRLLCEALELDTKRTAADLSLGNKKKVAIVAAMQHQPDLLLLDEPTSGLDPLMQQRLFELLRAEQDRGATIFLSSHVLAEVERVCTRIAIIKAGKLVRESSVAELKANSTRIVDIDRNDVAAASVLRLDGVTDVHIERSHARFVYGGPLPALFAALSLDAPDDVAIGHPSLEQIVLSHYGTDKSTKSSAKPHGDSAPSNDAPSNGAPSNDVRSAS